LQRRPCGGRGFHGRGGRGEPANRRRFVCPRFGLDKVGFSVNPFLAGSWIAVRGPAGAASRDVAMATGTVKWFNTEKGYGFIQPADGGKDVFVHITAVKEAGLMTLAEGQKVSFDLKTERGKTAAGDLKVL
jgi:CspA family cold shock protein